MAMGLTICNLLVARPAQRLLLRPQHLDRLDRTARDHRVEQRLPDQLRQRQLQLTENLLGHAPSPDSFLHGGFLLFDPVR